MNSFKKMAKFTFVITVLIGSFQTLKSEELSIPSGEKATRIDLLNSDGTWKFLGTLAGNQDYQKTYQRKYVPFGMTDNLRKSIDFIFVKTLTSSDIKRIGENYNYTPGRNTPSSDMQGGGFFRIVKELGETEKSMSSFSYALNTFDDNLNKISNESPLQRQNALNAYGIEYTLDQYFESVSVPRDGDLVIYKNSVDLIKDRDVIFPAGVATHAGIYRDSEPNWNSPKGGTIESKWMIGTFSNNLLIFQHDIFFVPYSFGDTVEFYRLKDNLNEPTLPQRVEDPMYTMKDDGVFVFTRSEENLLIRDEISNIPTSFLLQKYPQIKKLPITFFGICSHYAFGKVLGTCSSPLGGNAENHSIIQTNIVNKNFTLTTSPEKGDLVVYYISKDISIPVHWGVYYSDNLVESKWGKDDVYLHPPFYVPKIYGDYIRYYRLNSNSVN